MSQSARVPAHAPVTPRTGRFARLAAVAALVAVPVLGFASPALAHDELLGVVPVADADGGVESVRLTFSNSIIEVGTEIVVTDDAGDDVTDGDPVIDGPDVTQPLTADLAPGAYDAAWRVVSSDGHPIEGFFVLNVPESGDATVQLGTAAGEAASDDAGTAEHSEETESAPAEEGAAQPEAVAGETQEAPVGVVIAIVVGGVAVIAVAVAALTVGRRRRERGMAADAQGPAGPANGSATDKSGTAADDRGDRA
ncbi:copper resistance CopC family protein [Leucobacter massiliensis]|nr:copper resistance protein CopC [Leucobacter massiliensis]